MGATGPGPPPEPLLTGAEGPCKDSKGALSNVYFSIEACQKRLNQEGSVRRGSVKCQEGPCQ